jgi:SAM-dependent methyltransferase
MEYEDIIAANRAAWNETALIHAEAQLERLLQQVAQPGFSTLDPVERDVFSALGLQGKDVAQLCCNNGRELLSVKLAGARRCVGFDLSEAFLDQARKLVAAAGTELEFVRGDVLAIPERFNAAFGIVYVTVGALGWFPEVSGFFATAARLLRPQGVLFLYEMHPMLDMFDPGSGLEVRHSYFRREPYVNEDEPDYLNPDKRVAAKSYWFHHTLSDIFGACLEHGLVIEHFAEYEHDVSAVYASLADQERKPAMSYALVARREHGASSASPGGLRVVRAPHARRAV